MPANVLQYPVDITDTYIKATSFLGPNYLPWMALKKDITTNSGDNDSWLSSNVTFPQKFNIDHGDSFIASSIYIDNYHHNGGGIAYGVKDIRLYGTNSSAAFNNTIGTDTTDLDLIGEFYIPMHADITSGNPFWVNVSSNTAYRYSIIIILSSHNNSSYFGFRRIGIAKAYDSLDVIISPTNIIKAPYIEEKFIIPFISNDRYFTYSFKENKLIYNSAYKGNFKIVLDMWNKGVLDKVKIKYISSNLKIYDFPEVSFRPSYKSYTRIIPRYTNGDMTTDFNGYLSGKVSIDGTPRGGSLVRLYYNIDGSLISSTTTDEEGNFAFDYLEEGKNYYTIIVYEEGYNALVYTDVVAGVLTS